MEIESPLAEEEIFEIARNGAFAWKKIDSSWDYIGKNANGLVARANILKIVFSKKVFAARVELIFDSYVIGRTKYSREFYAIRTGEAIKNYADYERERQTNEGIRKAREEIK